MQCNLLFTSLYYSILEHSEVYVEFVEATPAK